MRPDIKGHDNGEAEFEADLDLRSKVDRRKFFQLLGVGGGALLAGCAGGDGNGGGNGTGTGTTGGSGNNTTPQGGLKHGGHLRVATSTSPQTISPFKGITVTDYVFKETMYSRLTTVDKNLQTQPNLAKEWNLKDGGKKITFVLQDDAKFPSGKNVLAEDVVATVNLLLSDKVSAGEKDVNPLQVNDGEPAIEVEDDKRLTFTLSRADAPYPKRVTETGSTFNVVPKNVAQNKFDQVSNEDFGNGPFNLVEFEKGDHYTFEANDDYHLTDEHDNQLPYVDKMTWKIISDPIPRVNSLRDKRVDALRALPPKTLKQAKNMSGLQVKSQHSGKFINVVLNTDLEPFQDVRVRKAMKYAMDRDEMLTAISGRGAKGHHSPVSPVHEFYAENINDPFGAKAKPEKAKSLLQEAGHGNGLELPTLYYSQGETPEKGPITQVFQQQMKNVGIDFNIKLLTPDTWLSEYWNKDDVWYMSTWVMRVEDTTVPMLALRSDGSWNTARWSNEKYDNALDKAFKATSKEDRAKNLKTCQQVHHTEGAWLHCAFLDVFGAAQGYVQEYEMMPTTSRSYLSQVALSSEAPQGP